MLRAISFAALAVLGLANAAYADSSTAQVRVDSGGMPRCLSVPKSDDGVIFVWKNSSGYGRDVKAISLSQARNLWADDDSMGANCQGYRDLLNSRGQIGDDDATFITVTENTQSVFGVDLSADVRAAIGEIRLGADVYHTEQSGPEFLKNNPITDYNRSVNRELTKKYGQGFSGQIYKAWVEEKPENATFKAQVLTHLQSLEQGTSRAQDTTKKLAPYTLVMAPGYMQPIAQGRAADMLSDLESVGIKVQVLNIGQMDSIDDNITLLQSQMRPMLLSGKKLIIMGLSKGMPEILTASTRLLQEPAVKASQGRIAGVLSLSGMFDGAFTVDWAQSFRKALRPGSFSKNSSIKKQKPKGSRT